ncbi:hypothetical protein H4582DRAFT_2058533 [Lactarius indigo]|nr:hypothetical protein H4582DRAFT_2058533 [Lactarius indigo]
MHSPLATVILTAARHADFPRDARLIEDALWLEVNQSSISRGRGRGQVDRVRIAKISRNGEHILLRDDGTVTSSPDADLTSPAAPLDLRGNLKGCCSSRGTKRGTVHSLRVPMQRGELSPRYSSRTGMTSKGIVGLRHIHVSELSPGVTGPGAGVMGLYPIE